MCIGGGVKREIGRKEGMHVGKQLVRIERRNDEVGVEMGWEITNCLGGSQRVEEGIEEISEHMQEGIKGDLTYGVKQAGIEVKIGG